MGNLRAMRPCSLTKARWEQDVRGRLERAALELFAQKGYDRTTVAETAERVGRAKSTLFRYFADKREMPAAALTETLRTCGVLDPAALAALREAAALRTEGFPVLVSTEEENDGQSYLVAALAPRPLRIGFDSGAYSFRSRWVTVRSSNVGMFLAVWPLCAVRRFVHSLSGGSAISTVKGRMPVFCYLVHDDAQYFRLVLDVLLEEEANLGIHLSTAEIGRRLVERLAVEPELLEALPPADVLLESLYRWRNVERIHNMRRSGTAQEFLKKDFLYQLTSTGAQVHRMVGEIDRDLGTAGSLQKAMLPEILEALGQLEAAIGSTDLAAASRSFHRVVGGFARLSENAKRFVQGLNQSLALDGEIEVEAFLAYKDVVVSYLQDFIAALSRYGPRISVVIMKIEKLNILERFPEIAGEDAAPELGITRPEVIDREAARMRAQWDRVRSWFLEGDDRMPVTHTLQERAAGAVSHIMLIIRQLNDQRSRRHNRSADLLQLAAWFDRAGSEREVRALWRSAFGTFPARHLGTPRDLESNSEIRPDLSWWSGDAAPVSMSFRAAGPRARNGPPPRLPDPRARKARLAAAQRDEKAKETEAERALVARGPVRISALGTLEQAEAEVLLRCLDRVLSVPCDASQVRRATTGDGRLLIVLAPPEEPGFGMVTLPGGELRLADCELTIHLLGEVNREALDR
ncbi:TIGR02677 family protein [Kitasatospora sp. NPDC088134]|uniref:TIGR02677 family protein n=1 Tax=Kitasatospora sp. NPDC088134 TaxID=3364071 RepID=UPI0037FB3488